MSWRSESPFTVGFRAYVGFWFHCSPNPLTHGKLKSWDHQPLVDASQQYMRNHIDLDDLERKARYPQPCQDQ